MKRIVCSLLAAVAVSLAPLAYAQSGPQSAMPPAPEGQSGALPAADPPAMAETHVAAATANTRLAALVPAGLSPEDACRGFKDLSVCSAALHVSQNLNIPFADLKDRVTAGQSLGTAIHALKPNADSRREAQRAEEQAREDLRSPG
jgi:hypothetical protein